MNKNIYSYLGGDPLFIDDLEFAQNGIIDAFKGLSAIVGGDGAESYVISGCGISYDGITYTVAAGYVCYKGEICKVDSHTVSSPLYWGMIITYDAAGNQTFGDGLVHDTLEIRKAKIYSTAPADNVPVASMKQFYSMMQTRLALAHPWSANFSFNTDYSNYGAPYLNVGFRFDEINGAVRMRGHAKKGTPASHTTDIKVLTISDPTIIPASEQTLSAASTGDNFNAGRPVTVIIKTDGTVWVKADPGNPFGSGDISFDGLSYYL